MDDQTAISRLKQGDLTGLDILVNRYQVRAVHAAYLVVYDRALAEDGSQTAFLKAVERIHQFDDRSRQGSFAYQAVSFHVSTGLVVFGSNPQYNNFGGQYVSKR